MTDYTPLTPPVAMQMVMDGIDCKLIEELSPGNNKWFNLVDNHFSFFIKSIYRIKTTDLEEWNRSQEILSEVSKSIDDDLRPIDKNEEKQTPKHRS